MILNFFLVNCDAAENWQTNIQDSATPMLEGMQFFYNELMFYMVSIGFAVVIMLIIIFVKFSDQSNKKSINFSHASLLEIVWTLIPAVILFFLSITSFGINLDACLGRLIQASLFIKLEGVYYGQCSEICGVNHGFMPIAVKKGLNKYFYYSKIR